MNSIAGRIVVSTTTVTTIATAIPTTATTGRRVIDIYNNGSQSVYLGPSGVTTSTGYPLSPGASKPFDLSDKVVLYGITSTGTSDVRSMEGS